MASATFTIFDPNHAAYIDATGSGCETICHVYENKRVTICWCSYDSLCRIMRLWCWGRVIEHDSPEFPKMLERMGKKAFPGARAIIDLKVWKVSTSCGMAVPLLMPRNDVPQEQLEQDLDVPKDAAKKESVVKQFQNREDLNKFAAKLGPERVVKYHAQKNTQSLDGLPGMRSTKNQTLRRLRVYDVFAWLQRETGGLRTFCVGVVLGMLLMMALQRVEVSESLAHVKIVSK